VLQRIPSATDKNRTQGVYSAGKGASELFNIFKVNGISILKTSIPMNALAVRGNCFTPPVRLRRRALPLRQAAILKVKPFYTDLERNEDDIGF
jgi:hypothetical protein